MISTSRKLCSSRSVVTKFKYDVDSLNGANSENSDLKFTFLDTLLDKATAILAAEHDAICIFVNDICDRAVLEKLSAVGVVRKILGGKRYVCPPTLRIIEICRTSMCRLQQRRPQDCCRARNQGYSCAFVLS